MHSTPRNLRRPALFVVLAVSGALSVASAQSLLEWNAANGDWANAANWAPAQIPGAADYVFIQNGGTVEIVSSGAATFLLNVGSSSGAGTLEVTGLGVLAFTGGSAGYSGTGNVSVTNGGTVTTLDFSLGGSDATGAGFLPWTARARSGTGVS